MNEGKEGMVLEEECGEGMWGMWCMYMKGDGEGGGRGGSRWEIYMGGLKEGERISVEGWGCGGRGKEGEVIGLWLVV